MSCLASHADTAEFLGLRCREVGGEVGSCKYSGGISREGPCSFCFSPKLISGANNQVTKTTDSNESWSHLLDLAGKELLLFAVLVPQCRNPEILNILHGFLLYDTSLLCVISIQSSNSNQTKVKHSLYVGHNRQRKNKRRSKMTKFLCSFFLFCVGVRLYVCKTIKQKEMRGSKRFFLLINETAPLAIYLLGIGHRITYCALNIIIHFNQKTTAEQN